MKFLYLTTCAIFVLPASTSAQDNQELDAPMEPVSDANIVLPDEIAPVKREPITAERIAQDFHWELASRTLVFFGTGFEGGAVWHSKLRVSGGLFWSPGFLSSGFGTFSGMLAGKAEYKSIFNSVITGQMTPMAGVTYHFKDDSEGAWIGGSLGYSSVSGAVKLSDIEAATGRSYTILRTALTTGAKAQVLTVSASLIWAEISGGYAWKLGPRWSFFAGGGLIKSISASSSLKTDAKGFDSSPGGAALLEGGRSDMDRILGQFGLSPTATIAFRYAFL